MFDHFVELARKVFKTTHIFLPKSNCRDDYILLNECKINVFKKNVQIVLLNLKFYYQNFSKVYNLSNEHYWVTVSHPCSISIDNGEGARRVLQESF